MATFDIIRYTRNDITNHTTSVESCTSAPSVSLVYDIDGPRGAFGSIQSVEPNADITYEYVFLKYNYNVDIDTGGELTLDDVDLLDGDHVWLTGQVDSADNGIYIVRADGSWEFYCEVTDTIFVDLGVRSTDSVDGDITRDVVIDYSDVNFGDNGFYSIYYHSLNSRGILTTKIRKVKVIPNNASISPVPGYKITQYEISTDVDTELLTSTNK